MNRYPKPFDSLQQRYVDGIGCASIARVALLEAELAIESESDQRLKKIEECVEQLKQEKHYRNVRFKNRSERMGELCLSMADRIHGEIIMLEEQELRQRH